MSLAATYSSLVKFATGLNSLAGRICLRLSPEAGNLIVIALHAIVNDKESTREQLLNPRYVLTLDELERTISYYLNCDYRAIAPADLLGQPLSSTGRYVMFTFDDGYANNLQVIPILEKYRVPAMFALVSDYIAQQRTFWWDLVYQKRVADGVDASAIDKEVDCMLREKPNAIATRLASEFGVPDLVDAHEICRPMRSEEVRALAKHPYIHWANHTAGHEYLPSCNESEVRLSVGRAQESLQELTGEKPISMVYPYGGHNAQVRSICRELGLQLGFSMATHKQWVPITDQAGSTMAIPRHAIYQNQDVDNQCLETRIKWKPSWLLRNRNSNYANISD